MKTTPIKWVAAQYGKKKMGIGPAGGGATFFYVSRDEWDVHDSKRVQLILNALNKGEESER